MLTKLIARNFKRFGQVEIPLGNPVVFIGPNNSGKTSALQALALWHKGLSAWTEKRVKGVPEKRPGVTINRLDLLTTPVPDSNLLWKDLRVQHMEQRGKKKKSEKVRIEILVEGVTKDKAWNCGLEFDYVNKESFLCRPVRSQGSSGTERPDVPEEARAVRMAFLPPMSGLASRETHLGPGAINVRIGEGKTAEVLRNLCYVIYGEHKELWAKLCASIKSLFNVELADPEYVTERDEIDMTYKEAGVPLDLSSSGRGLQQTLLLLAYMYANPGAVMLLDEPDAHLEILRQRHIYQLLCDVARENGNQVVAASHSEVLLNEAADRDMVIAFVGQPHLIKDRRQVLKSLREIGFDQYALAKQTGWVLYLEGSTDLAILRALAARLNHAAAVRVLERPFVHYVSDQPVSVSRHFFALKEAKPDLKGVALFDRLTGELPAELGAKGMMWRKREIESYLCFRETLLAYAEQTGVEESEGPLFSPSESKRRVKAMQEVIDEMSKALASLGKGSPWTGEMKVSDEFLHPLFRKYFEHLGLLPNVMDKKSFHELARFVPAEMIDVEIKEKLDAIVAVAASAKAES